MAVPAQAIISDAKRKREPLNPLARKPRPFESFIQVVLFLCGVASIFTTVGIVLTLGIEASHFFTTPGTIAVERQFAQAVTPDSKEIELTAGGFAFTPGLVIESEEELMLVTEVVDREHLIVERGYNNSPISAHPSGKEIHQSKQVTLTEFFTNTTWQPQIGQFGILPLLTSTLMISFIAMLIAIPVGLGTAIYLSEYASPRVRQILKPTLELLAGVPTVVFGYFALTFVTPILRSLLGENVVSVYNMASAGVVIGILIVPTITTISEDALRAVPRSLREASFGLGATRFETTVKVLVPSALSGILAAVLLGISRAIGETMVVAIAAGAGPNLTLNPFEAAETITGHIARISTGDLSYGSMDYNSLFALGLTLFVITLIMNFFSSIITRRFREAYQ
jgi:phosphate transport system permease protein